MRDESMRLRRASRADESALFAMQAASFRTLGRGYYADEVIETFVERVGTMDPALLDEGRYYVLEKAGEIVACGGWSTRAPQYSRFAGRRDARAAGPVVRSIFVAPALARLGLGRMIMKTVEAEVAAAGFNAVGLMATLSGYPFYLRLGYVALDRVALRIGEGLEFAGISMLKDLRTTAQPRAA